MAFKDLIILSPEDEHLRDAHSWRQLRTPYTTYAIAGQHPQHVLLHRLVTGCPKGLVPDHLNGNGLDNRRENLVVRTQADNILRAYPEGGVYPSGRKWKVQIGGKYLGTFETREEAVAFRKAEWIKRCG